MGKETLPFSPFRIKETFNPLKGQGLCLTFEVNDPKTPLRPRQTNSRASNKLAFARPKERPQSFGNALGRPSRDGEDMAQMPKLRQRESVNNSRFTLKGKYAPRPSRQTRFQLGHWRLPGESVIVTDTESSPKERKLLHPRESIGSIRAACHAPSHIPLDLPLLCFAPEAASKAEEVSKVASMDASVDTATVVSSA